MGHKPIEEHEKKGVPRRVFLQTTLFVPAGFLFFGSDAAMGLPKLGEDDPRARALGYTHISDSEENTCSNCGLYHGDPGEEWGECSIFPKKVVSATGWCSSWVPISK